MLDRKSCERRVYRLATLLTGNPAAATKVIARVIDAQPDLRHLDSAHMDRLTVLRSREIAPSTLADERVPHLAAEALAALSDQKREAWVFARIYRLDEREMARAMDCSVTATQRHLEQADAEMLQKLGATEAAATAAQDILSYAMSLDVPEFYRVQRQRKRRMKVAAIIAAGLVALAVILLGLKAVGYWV